MAKITFITRDNDKITVEADSGSIMELAVANNVVGIEGECGGVCSCATCHVHVAEAFFEKTGKATETENDLLEFEDNLNDFSRLSCQIEISEKIDGIVVKVAN